MISALLSINAILLLLDFSSFAENIPLNGTNRQVYEKPVHLNDSCLTVNKVCSLLAAIFI